MKNIVRRRTIDFLRQRARRPEVLMADVPDSPISKRSDIAASASRRPTRRSSAARCGFTGWRRGSSISIMHTLPSENLDFAWDRPETAATLRAKLAGAPSQDWLRTAAWLMCEARVDQVWDFLTLRQIADRFPQLSPLLGRRRPLWEYLIRTAHELGRI